MRVATPPPSSGHAPTARSSRFVFPLPRSTSYLLLLRPLTCSLVLYCLLLSIKHHHLLIASSPSPSCARVLPAAHAPCTTPRRLFHHSRTLLRMTLETRTPLAQTSSPDGPHSPSHPRPGVWPKTTPGWDARPPSRQSQSGRDVFHFKCHRSIRFDGCFGSHPTAQCIPRGAKQP
jgi:hypothetical protein